MFTYEVQIIVIEPSLQCIINPVKQRMSVHSCGFGSMRDLIEIIETRLAKKNSFDTNSSCLCSSLKRL